MKIIIDENMPYAEKLFSQLGRVTSVAGRSLVKETVQDADALMVRSVTTVDKNLIQDSSLRFIGTATAGFDHINIQDLQAAGIGFAAAPGCNAIAVVEYVISALFTLAERDDFELKNKTIGIVGVGNVGRRLQVRCEALGMTVLLCDPPRAKHEDNTRFETIDTLITHADIITLHTPLTLAGEDATWHLMDIRRLQNLRANAILINACRGAVVDNRALLTTLRARHDLSVVLDVWENEPALNLELLALVDLATAHIAGYTLEGKARGTTQVFEAFCHYLGKPQSVSLASLLPLPAVSQLTLNPPLTQGVLKRLAHLVYDIRLDDALLRNNASEPGGFDRLRKNYQVRREWSSLQITSNDSSVLDLLQGLGFTAISQS